MDPAKMERWLDELTPEEIRDGLWFVQVIARQDGYPPEQADEWRKRILARQRFLWLDGSTPND